MLPSYLHFQGFKFNLLFYQFCIQVRTGKEQPSYKNVLNINKGKDNSINESYAQSFHVVKSMQYHISRPWRHKCLLVVVATS